MGRVFGRFFKNLKKERNTKNEIIKLYKDGNSIEFIATKFNIKIAEIVNIVYKDLTK